MAVTSVPIRRVRRVPYITDEKHRTFHQRLRLDLETGVGLASGTGSDPQIDLRWSDDGAHTWSNIHTTSAGKLGEYRRRALWQRLGASRQRIYEISICEPVKVVILGAELDVLRGTN